MCRLTTLAVFAIAVTLVLAPRSAHALTAGVVVSALGYGSEYTAEDYAMLNLDDEEQYATDAYEASHPGWTLNWTTGNMTVDPPQPGGLYYYAYVSAYGMPTRKP